MKYVIIIPDGAADHPLEDLDGQTPFQAANKPHADQISIDGRQGTVATTPKGMSCGSDVCVMNMLGYDPARYHKGRAPLEAAALGIELDPADWIFRVNLVTVIEGKMQDHSAGQIHSDEGALLLTDLAAHLHLPDMTLYPGVSYRNILVDTSCRDVAGTSGGASAGASGGASRGEQGRNWSKLVTTPPHDIPGEPIGKYLPTGGPHAGLLRDLIAQSETVFAAHEINQTRQELQELPATHLWPWGQGQKPEMPSFASRFGLRGAVITAVDLLAGTARFIQWDRLDVPGQTSYHDTDYVAAGEHAIAALDDYDLVCVHVEAPDEAAHAADTHTKVAAIEAIDEHIVGPVHEALQDRGPDYRLLYMPDHYTAIATRKHDPTPVPFAMCGKRVRSVLQRPFNEANSAESDLHIEFGYELMEYFLFSGLA